ncbi:hypothetical protein KPH14_008120 [Odynerus spinipes]|uniref:C2H2-type domain-containing protein n=1 Tax=Odynerus spinipes TaxID=1348599 RepID=A0AAD9RKA6_9HYME|nr:hypothetical protein KPH14_008120 [Odynerus spinipes]
MTTMESPFEIEELMTILRKHCIIEQERNFYNILSQQSATAHFDIKQQPCCSKKKHNNNVSIPNDIYMEITELLKWPVKKGSSKIFKVTNTTKSIQNCKGTYTKSMFMLEEKIFLLPERITTMIEKGFEFSFVSKKSQKRFCLLCNENISDNLQKFYEHIHCSKHVSCLKQMMENKECSFLAKEFMKIISNDYIRCYGCQVDCFNCLKSFLEHSKNNIHKKISSQLRKYSNYQCNQFLKELKNYWYNIQTYACIPCNRKFNFKLDFLQHLDEIHRDETDIVYDFCIPCAILWAVYEDKTLYSYLIHCNLTMHKYLAKNLDFKIKEMPKHVKDLLNHAEKTAEDLFRLSEDIFKNDLMQKKLLQSLKSSLGPQFPALKIYPFGSRLTGLGFPNSDIDIFLDCNGDAYGQNDSSSSVCNYLDITKKLLCKDEDSWIMQEILKQSRTPIIRLRHRLTELQCDISFTNGLSVENTKLIRSFNEACPPCRKLILFVKKWLSSCCLPGRHCITNYALSWFVIFYLQKSKFLPSIDTLIKQKSESRLISGWETGVDCPIPTKSMDMSFTKLLIGFFNFYGDFNYKDHVACPLLGDVVRKQDFINISNLPKAMSLYTSYVKTSGNSEMFRIDSPMCIQDPLDLSHNLTKAVQPLTLEAFKKHCKDSVNIVCDISHD